jgi:hypothetical protein
MEAEDVFKQLDGIHRARHQYSEGSKMVVTAQSASVMTHTFLSPTE